VQLLYAISVKPTISTYST